MADLSILVEGKPLELGDKAKLTFELNSPAFDRNNLRSSFTYPQTLADTPKNRLALGVKGNYQAKNAFAGTKAAEVVSNGKRVMSGTVVTKTKKYNLNNLRGEISVAVSDDRGKFALLMQNKKLSDLTMNGPVTITGSALPTPISDHTLLATSIHSKNTTDWANNIIANGHEYFVLPSFWCTKAVYQEIIYGTIDDSLYHQVANRCNASGVIEAFKDVSGTPRVMNAIIAPCYYLHQVVKHCFTDFGYTFIDESGLYENADFMKSYIQSNYNILRYNCDLYYQSFPSYTLQYGVYTELDTTFSASDILPDFPVLDFINDIMIKFGAWFDIQGSRVYLRKFAQQKRSKLSGFKIHPEIQEDKVEPSGFVLAYKTPDGSNLYSNFKDEFIDSLVEIDDISLDSTVERNTTFIANDTGFVYRRNSDSTNEFLFQNIFKTGSGDNRNNNFEMPVVPLHMMEKQYIWNNFEIDEDNPPVSTTATAFLSVTEGSCNHYFAQREIEFAEDNVGMGDFYQVGVTVLPVQEQPHNKTFIAVGFYYGVQDVYTQRYPFGSPYQYIPESNTKLSSFHYGLIGSDNLVEVFWPFLMKIFDSTLRVLIQVYVDEKTIEQHDWAYQEHIRGTDFYISKIRGEFPLGKAVTYECFKIE